jgi:transglutaminase-like putative cysteine protease
MSRLKFRASVEDPRPLAAWVMVAMAGATLSITGQLAPWAIAVALCAGAYSLLNRLSPGRWQRSPLVLNVAILSISALSAVVALRGGPATIALAHFAVMTQGLQLLDARPRKSEFLLVALALFQVILAANLTDSVLFPPMLILFLASTTWTLLVHTLRSEAIEAGARNANHRNVNAGLARVTLWASTVSIILALIIFTLLPRFRSSMIERNGSGIRAVAGFTDQVRLGTIGKIRQDSAVVLRVETLEGTAPDVNEGYWRGLAFDHFDGVRWSVVYRIEVDVNGSLYSPSDQARRVRYTIRTEARLPHDRELRKDRSIPPRRRSEAFLTLPALGPAVRDLALRITAGRETDADRVRALEAHLRSAGSYTDTPREMDPELGDSPVEGFLLGELSGHCEYFASGMVVLARSIDIPARLVNGFAGGQRNEIGDFVELTRADAHAWVEVHYESAGWVRYDPTPPNLRIREDIPPNLANQIAAFGSMMELWWYQRVVDFDTSDQVEMIRTGWLAWRSLRESTSTSTSNSIEVGRDRSGNLELNVGFEFVFIVGSIGALVFALYRIRRPGKKRITLPRSYAQALALLRRRGLPRTRATTARDYAKQVQDRVPAEAARAFSAITESYLAERFGRVPATVDAVHLKTLRRKLPRRLQSIGSQSAP